MRPFLKWAGGKYRIVQRIREHLPDGKRLIEPFVGSGAVFLNTDFDEYILSDINQDLIRVYEILQQDGDSFISYCKPLFTPENNAPDRYYELRTEFNETDDLWRKSALFIYLNRHGYNGLCRYNSNGKFNVPFGRYKRPYFPEPEMRYFAHKAQRARFCLADFRAVMEQAQPGDVIYCDPPYVPLSKTARFTDYAAGGFGPQDQADLAQLAAALGNRGIPVLISNHETDFTNQAYAAAKIERFDVQRMISCDGANRGSVTEVLALFGT
ncbi:Dam family site-specific DNA-(adenine-N6)-methyltransferase [Alicyclobacillus kakegawensis]|uniref:Dam family site-specific DNA-(adenine-N6)-methyltransferase n=1 Tax=Alicyclobacillus kakegawensis TaxID=392012 RepID=UPI0009F830E1|nr:Dam family site-specific DNA-(adenine-N6)-methyltransferase [Alicyclobacillus kakegawensis]